MTPGKRSLEVVSNEVINCQRCPRMVAWREKVGIEKRKAFRDQIYWAKPVPGFGDHEAQVMVLGLAPGAHGSNRTGRMFTGDDSGKFLFRALHKAGFASQAEGSIRDDGLVLSDIWITAVCRCVPPDNKPEADEILNCRSFLEVELSCFEKLEGIVALGRIAYDNALTLTHRERIAPEFKHGAFCPSTSTKPWILGSYHPSRQNTQTGRLTTKMFDEVWTEVRRLLGLK
jgi:uracil-DNA glycosylase family 4